jgi:uncharacterized phage-associated protein
MAARLDSVARLICETGDWRVTNLQLQKILYLVQMLYMGQKDGERLVEAIFEAWDYGPVEPRLYRKVSQFGSSPIEDVFTEAKNFNKEDPRREFIKDVTKQLLVKRPGELVEITHWEDGAWATNYEPEVRGIRIPDADIVAEYQARIKAAA